MPLALTGPLKFSDIQTEFGGTNPISMSEYYKDASTGYASSVSDMSVKGTAINVGKFRGKSNFSDIDYVYTDTSQSYTFTVPAGCSKISVLCVGGGGNSIENNGYSLWNSGSGGALIWANFNSVDSNETFVVSVGAANTASYFQDTSAPITIKLLANGGSTQTSSFGINGGTYSVAVNTANRLSSWNGGNGGRSGVYDSGKGIFGGGGGAGGYSGNGGNGATTNDSIYSIELDTYSNDNPRGMTNGSGGGGGGGANTRGKGGPLNTYYNCGGGGGGVGIYGLQFDENNNIISGKSGGTQSISGIDGKGGSNGNNADVFFSQNTGDGGLYGGGGAIGNYYIQGKSYYGRRSGNGAQGVIRIMCVSPTSTRSFPNTTSAKNASAKASTEIFNNNPAPVMNAIPAVSILNTATAVTNTLNISTYISNTNGTSVTYSVLSFSTTYFSSVTIDSTGLLSYTTKTNLSSTSTVIVNVKNNLNSNVDVSIKFVFS